MNKFIDYYLNRIIPAVGQIVSQSASAYHYLSSSIQHFLAPEEIVKLMKDIGLKDISCKRMMFGIVYLYIARKIDTA